MPRFNRLESLRQAYFQKESESEAFIAVGGADSCGDRASSVVLQYLFGSRFGPAVIQPEVCSDDAVIDDMFIVVTRSTVTIFAGDSSKAGFERILEIIKDWPGAQCLYVPETFAAQESVAEEYKARCFVEHTYRLSDVGIIADPTMARSQVPASRSVNTCAEIIEMWPIVQASALESHGMRSRGFFSATRTVRNAALACLECVGIIDGHALMHLVESVAPRAISHFRRSMEVLQCPFWLGCAESADARHLAYAASHSLTEDMVADEVAMLSEFSRATQLQHEPSASSSAGAGRLDPLLPVSDDKTSAESTIGALALAAHAAADHAGCWFGSRTAQLVQSLFPGGVEPLDSRCSGGVPLGSSGLGGGPAVHAVLVAHDPASGIKIGRTILLHQASGADIGVIAEVSSTSLGAACSLGALQRGHSLAIEALCAEDAPVNGSSRTDELHEKEKTIDVVLHGDLAAIAAACFRGLVKAWRFPSVVEAIGKDAARAAMESARVILEMFNAAGQLECVVQAYAAGSPSATTTLGIGECERRFHRPNSRPGLASPEADVETCSVGKCQGQVHSKMIALTSVCNDVRVGTNALGSMLLADTLVLVRESMVIPASSSPVGIAPDLSHAKLWHSHVLTSTPSHWQKVIQPSKPPSDGTDALSSSEQASRLRILSGAIRQMSRGVACDVITGGSCLSSADSARVIVSRDALHILHPALGSIQLLAVSGQREGLELDWSVAYLSGERLAKILEVPGLTYEERLAAYESVHLVRPRGDDDTVLQVLETIETEEAGGGVFSAFKAAGGITTREAFAPSDALVINFQDGSRMPGLSPWERSSRAHTLILVLPEGSPVRSAIQPLAQHWPQWDLAATSSPAAKAEGIIHGLPKLYSVSLRGRLRKRSQGVWNTLIAAELLDQSLYARSSPASPLLSVASSLDGEKADRITLDVFLGTSDSRALDVAKATVRAQKRASALLIDLSIVSGIAADAAVCDWADAAADLVRAHVLKCPAPCRVAVYLGGGRTTRDLIEMFVAYQGRAASGGASQRVVPALGKVILCIENARPTQDVGLSGIASPFLALCALPGWISTIAVIVATGSSINRQLSTHIDQVVQGTGSIQRVMIETRSGTSGALSIALSADQVGELTSQQTMHEQGDAFTLERGAQGSTLSRPSTMTFAPKRMQHACLSLTRAVLHGKRVTVPLQLEFQIPVPCVLDDRRVGDLLARLHQPSTQWSCSVFSPALSQTRVSSHLDSIVGIAGTVVLVHTNTDSGDIGTESVVPDHADGSAQRVQHVSLRVVRGGTKQLIPVAPHCQGEQHGTVTCRMIEPIMFGTERGDLTAFALATIQQKMVDALMMCRPVVPHPIAKRVESDLELSSDERQAFEHGCRTLAIPGDWMFDGTQWLRYDGMVSYLHPMHTQIWQVCMQQLNVMIDDYNAKLTEVRIGSDAELHGGSDTLGSEWWLRIPTEPDVRGAPAVQAVLSAPLVRAHVTQLVDSLTDPAQEAHRLGYNQGAETEDALLVEAGASESKEVL